MDPRYTIHSQVWDAIGFDSRDYSAAAESDSVDYSADTDTDTDTEEG